MSSMAAKNNQADMHTELVLVETFPVTSFFYREVHRPNIKTRSNDIAEYVKIHRAIFEAQTWVIRGAYLLDSDYVLLTDCVDSLERKTSYDLGQNLVEDLKIKWPHLSINCTEENNWQQEYYEFGSCITKNATFYFQEALRLLKKYDIGIILKESGIHPGKDYSLGHILKSITNVLGKHVYIKCLQPQNTKKQYLSDVRICLNSAQDLVDCKHRQDESNINQCDTKKSVDYPVVPDEYL